MATADYYITKDDTLPVISATLKNADGSIVDLTGGAYQFLITNADTGVTVARTAVVDGLAINGGLKYQWVAQDTATPGLYRCKWVVTFGGNESESFPNNDYILVQVYDDPPGKIITSRADYDSVISILGVTIKDFSYNDIESIAFLQAAEAKVIDTLSAQSGYDTTVPSVVKIMAGTDPATALDKTHLKAAVVYQLAYLFGPGETNSVDVSQSVGPVSRDLGGIGETWLHQMEEYQTQCDYHIGKITGFKRWRVLT